MHDDDADLQVPDICEVCNCEYTATPNGLCASHRALLKSFTDWVEGDLHAPLSLDRDRLYLELGHWHPVMQPDRQPTPDDGDADADGRA